jgi:hypothetical protein
MLSKSNQRSKFSKFGAIAPGLKISTATSPETAITAITGVTGPDR